MAKRIEVSTGNQILTAYDGAKAVYKFDCVTGDSDHPTDRGSFQILWKDKTHVSHKYHVKMYYAMFFTQDGKAIHQYHGPGNFALDRMCKQQLSGWFGSHGCVRLTEEDASTLFEWAPLHTPIQIT